MKETETHIFFWREYLSNWKESPFVVDGVTYNCVEQWMMAKKAEFFGDKETLNKILATTSPREQKDLGRQVKNYDDQKWSEVRFDVVVQGTIEKYKQNKSLFHRLLKTGDKILVEASPQDNIWGVALSEDDPLILDPNNWKGQNLLGKALMEARKQLREMDNA